VVSFTPRPLYLRGNCPGTHWVGWWVGPRVVLGKVVKRKIPSPRRESNPRTPIIQPVAQCYTDWAIMALLPSSTKVKNAWNYTSTPAYVYVAWKLVKLKDNSIFTYRVQWWAFMRHKGREADHSPPSIAEVKNTWSYNSDPSLHKPSWHGTPLKKAPGQLYFTFIFYRNQSFITVFTRTHHWSLSSVAGIQSTASPHISLTVSSYLCLCLLSGLFSSGLTN
jgi:hypothetical protein